MLKLTIPIVDEYKEDKPDDLRNWNRALNSLHVFTGPVFFFIATQCKATFNEQHCLQWNLMCSMQKRFMQILLTES